LYSQLYKFIIKISLTFTDNDDYTEKHYYRENNVRKNNVFTSYYLYNYYKRNKIAVSILS